MVRLGVNIDHVATIRNARGGLYPCPVRAAHIAEAFGADGITAHLREDRRHIRDADIQALKDQIRTPLNLEMAHTPEMVETALRVKPAMVTLVPERRQELTTEGGLDVIKVQRLIKASVEKLHNEGVQVSLFIDPDLDQLKASHDTGARLIELHTGTYCHAYESAGKAPQAELDKLHEAAVEAKQRGLILNAGHGLHYDNVDPILDLEGLHELNIGHSLVSEAIFTGLGPAVLKMKEKLILANTQ